MTRRRLTPRQRAKIFMDANGVCHLCGARIAKSERWQADHVIALCMGGEDAPANMRPAHVSCHREKTTGDVGMLAKARRVEAKHIGAHQPKRRITNTRRQVDVPLSEKSDWRSRKEARLNGEE